MRARIRTEPRVCWPPLSGGHPAIPADRHGGPRLAGRAGRSRGVRSGPEPAAARRPAVM